MAGFLVHLITIFIILVIVITVLVLSISSANEITKIDNWKDNKYLKSAHKKLTYLSISMSLVVVFTIIFSIVMIFILEELILIFGGMLVYILIFFTIIQALTIGIVAAIAASDIRKSGQYNNNDHGEKAYTYSIIAAIIGIGLVGILIFYTIFHYFYTLHKKHKKKKDKEELTKILLEKKLDKKATQ